MRPRPFARTQNVGEFQGIRFDARARRLKRTNVVALDTVPMFTSSSRPLTMRSFAVFFAIPLVTRAPLRPLWLGSLNQSIPLVARAPLKRRRV